MIGLIQLGHTRTAPITSYTPCLDVCQSLSSFLFSPTSLVINSISRFLENHRLIIFHHHIIIVCVCIGVQQKAVAQPITTNGATPTSDQTLQLHRASFQQNSVNTGIMGPLEIDWETQENNESQLRRASIIRKTRFKIKLVRQLVQNHHGAGAGQCLSDAAPATPHCPRHDDDYDDHDDADHDHHDHDHDYDYDIRRHNCHTPLSMAA